MIRIVDKHLGCFLAALILLVSGWTGTVQAQSDPQLFLVTLAGDPLGGEAPVLLRWFSDRVDPGVDRYRIYRKSGPADSPGPMQVIAETQKLRNLPLIRSILERPEQERAYLDLLNLLNLLNPEQTVTPENYVQELLRVLEGQDNCESCEFRRHMLVQSNYGVAIVEGLGYVDRVSPGVYTYELRVPGSGSAPETVIGRVTLDASVPTRLPAPSAPVQVDIPGRRGNLTIYLRWKNPPALEDRRSVMFGYNVFRGEGDLSNQSFEQLLSQGRIRQINDLPILPPAEPEGAEDSYYFMDNNQNLQEEGYQGEPFRSGEVFTYWVAARDLFGRNGYASPSGVATARDTIAPDIPDNLRVAPAEDADDHLRLQLTWTRNSDDTVSYRIYRYRNYDHVRQKGPFPVQNGLVEGYLALVPQPTGEPSFRDPSVRSPQHDNAAFWYCLSAVDAAGNESALSSPVRGVIFDNTPPPSAPQPEVCTRQGLCEIKNFSFASLTASEVDPATVHVRLQISRAAPRIEGITLLRRIQSGNTSRTKTIGEMVFNGQNQLVVSDEFPRTNPGDEVTYTFFVTADGQPCGTFALPEKPEQRQSFHNFAAKGMDIQMDVSFDYSVREVCQPPVPGTTPYDPHVDGGPDDPIDFVFHPNDPDQDRILLYRSEDCEHYTLVSRGTFEEGEDGLSVTLQDDFAPDQGGTVCYAYRTVDENGNMGEMVFIPGQYTVPPAEGGRMTPVAIEALRTGDRSAPGMRLSWLGPKEAVAGYQILFGAGEELTGSETGVFLFPDACEYQEDIATFASSLYQTDDEAGTPIAANAVYWIHVKAVFEDGMELTSRNAVRFVWLGQNPQADVPPWPARDLPEAGPALIAKWFPPAANPSLLSYGVGVLLGEGTFDSIHQIQVRTQYANPPFLVYRKRIDKPGQDFIQISGRIDAFEFQGNGSRNPFIKVVDIGMASDGITHLIQIYYLDAVNLIEGAEYQYRVVEMNAETGELKRELGPTNTVEVQP